jgi:hypothetical protein
MMTVGMGMIMAMAGMAMVLIHKCVQLTMAKVQKLLISQNKEQSCAIDEEGTEHLLSAAIWGL